MKWDRTKGRPEPIRALNRIKEVENGEPLVSLLEYCPDVVMLRESVIPYLRRTVAEKLQLAAKTLPEGLRLGVIDAWRPFERQVRIYDFMWRSMEEARPEMSHSARRRAVCRFVAPVDQKAPPGHCTGAAVDLNLLDARGEILDVSAPYSRFEGAPTYVFGLEPEAERLRMILVSTLLNVGFSNCRDEWWHYSYGDAGWAVRMGESDCFYGKVDLEPGLYAEQEKEWIERMKERENPFLPSKVD